MVDWRRILDTAGTVAQGMSDIAIVNSWLEKNDNDAFARIVIQVKSSSTADVDRLDDALLSLAATSFNADTRRRLTKFYAIFKIAEFDRYKEFRGFPP